MVPASLTFSSAVDLLTLNLSGPLSRHVAMPLFRDLDLSGIAGVKLALGYGLGSSDVAAQTDMLTRGLVAEVLTLR